MPWKTSDVEGHIKGLTDTQKSAWVSIANSVLKSCVADGGKQSACEGKAIRIANVKARQAHLSREPLKILVSNAPDDGCWDGTKFKKSIIGVGKWKHPATGRMIDVTEDTLNQLVGVFHKCKQVGIDVWVPLQHTNDPLENTGWLDSIDILPGPGGLLAVGVFDILDPAVVEKIKNKTIKSVSPGILDDIINVRPDGTNESLGLGIEHVALTLEPVLQGQTEFVQMFDREGNEIPCDIYFPADKENLMPAQDATAMTEGTKTTQLPVDETENLISELAKVSRKSKQDLPDACFALVYKDVRGNKVRKLQYLDAGSVVNSAHLRNSLTRISDVKDAPAEVIASAREKLLAMAKRYLQSSSYARPSDQSIIAEFGKLEDALKKTRDAKAMHEMYDHYCSLVSQSLYGGLDETGQPFEAEAKEKQVGTIKKLTSEFLKMMKDHEDEDEMDPKMKAKMKAKMKPKMKPMMPGMMDRPADSSTENQNGDNEGVASESGDEGDEMVAFDRLAEMTGIPVAELTTETYLDKLSGFMPGKATEIKVAADKAAALEAEKVELEKTKAAMQAELSLAKRNLGIVRLDRVKARIAAAEVDEKLTPALRERVVGTFSLDAKEETAFDAEWDRQVSVIEAHLNVVEGYPKGSAIALARTDEKDLVDAAGQETPADKLNAEQQAALETERVELSRRIASAQGIDPARVTRDSYGRVLILDAPKKE